MPVSILVADDSVTMRRIMELTFAGEDARVTTVASGELCIENAKNSRPDVVFADGSMPGLDGYGVASAVKSTPGLEKTAVILMASQKHPYDEAKGRAAGVDDHILKPFDTQHVIDRVNQVLARPRAAAGAAAVPSKAQGTVVGHMMPPGPPAPAVPPAAPRAAAPVAPAKPVSPVPVAVAPAKAAPAVVTAAPVAPAKPAAPVPVAVAPAKEVRPAAAQPPTAAMSSANGVELASKLAGLGLTSAQMEGVLTLTREVIEQVVWEVVPELAETMIREEIRRLTAEG